MVSIKLLLLVLSLLLLYFVDLSLGMNQKINVDELFEEYKAIIEIKTGYKYDQLKITPKKLTTDGLAEIKKKQIEKLLCGYSYIGLHYLRISKLWLYGGDDTNVSGNVKNILVECTFSEEIQFMLTSLLNNWQPVTITPMWAIFMYTKFLEAVAGNEKEFNDDWKKKKWANFEKFILDVMNDSNCGKENEYNDELESSSYFKDLNKAKENPTNSIVLSGLIKNIKTNVSELLKFNERVVSVNEGKDSFSIEKLSLNDMLFKPDVMQLLMQDFCGIINWQEILNGMKQDYQEKMGKKNLQAQFEGLEILHSRFFNLLKIAMFRIILYHLLDINKSLSYKRKFLGLNPEQVAKLKFKNQNMASELTKFFEFTYAERDETNELKKFKNRFDTKCKKFNDIDSNNEDIERVQRFLSYFLRECGKDYFTFKNSFHANDEMYSIKWLKTFTEKHPKLVTQVDLNSEPDGAMIATVLNTFISVYLGNVSFPVIHSFIRFERNHHGWQHYG